MTVIPFRQPGTQILSLNSIAIRCKPGNLAVIAIRLRHAVTDR
jgi:hypothetical protein